MSKRVFFLHPVYKFGNLVLSGNYTFSNKIQPNLELFHQATNISMVLTTYPIKTWGKSVKNIWSNIQTEIEIQGYPQRMRLESQLYRINASVLIPYNCKLLSSCIQVIINNIFKDNTEGKTLNLNLGSSYLKSFKSSLQSHALWVTLFIKLTN